MEGDAAEAGVAFDFPPLSGCLRSTARFLSGTRAPSSVVEEAVEVVADAWDAAMRRWLFDLPPVAFLRVSCSEDLKNLNDLTGGEGLDWGSAILDDEPEGATAAAAIWMWEDG